MKKVLLSIALIAGISVANAGESQSNEDISKRIKPVGGVYLASDAPAVPSGPRSGEDVYKASCFACHGTGAMGAPKAGDTTDWAERGKQGMEVLIEHAVNGFNTMPPRGACAACSDDEIKAAVEFMTK